MAIQFIYVFIELLLIRQYVCVVNLIKRKLMNYPHKTKLFTRIKVINYTFLLKFMQKLHQQEVTLFIK
jgi:hypothetical protein